MLNCSCSCISFSIITLLSAINKHQTAKLFWYFVLGVLTGAFAVDVNPPAMTSVDNLASVFGNVLPAQRLRSQGGVRGRQWRHNVHWRLTTSGSRWEVLSPCGRSCKIIRYYYYYDYYYIRIWLRWMLGHTVRMEDGRWFKTSTTHLWSNTGAVLKRNEQFSGKCPGSS